MSDTIDTETFTSAATRAATEHGPVLLAALETLKAEISEIAGAMTKAELAEAITTDGNKWESRLTGKENKKELVDKLTGIRVRQTETNKELRELNEAQAADEDLMRHLNKHVEQRDAALAAFKGKTETISDLVYEMSWCADGLAVIGFLDRYVQRMITEVNDGADIREVAQFHAEQAFRTLVRIPSQMLTDTRVGAGGAELIYEAAAAQKFLAMVGHAYGALNGSMSLDIVNAM